MADLQIAQIGFDAEKCSDEVFDVWRQFDNQL